MGAGSRFGNGRGWIGWIFNVFCEISTAEYERAGRKIDLCFRSCYRKKVRQERDRARDECGGDAKRFRKLAV